MLSARRAKIVATLGPSLSAKEDLRSAIIAGLNIARLNFSHGDHKTHLQSIKNVRELSQSLNAPVGILQDLQGPKIRVGVFKNGSIHLEVGDEAVISYEFKIGEGKNIPTDFKEIASICKKGTQLLMDDGLIELEVTKVSGNKVFCNVIYGGELKDRKGLNIPGEDLPIDCLTEKDLKDLEFGLKNNVDYVALSFVREVSDIEKLREIINKKNPSVGIIAKIEKREAVENLEGIIEVSDGVMVARGDLAVEIGQSHLPGVQKKIIHLCNAMSTPVITATQMLDSMVENPRPTRAEVTDIANAVMDGSDALMLSAESASGKYPIKCIETMEEIIFDVEQGDNVFYYDIPLTDELCGVPEAIGASACLTALRLNAKAIVCMTTSGHTATMISSFRPKASVIAVTHKKEVLNHLELIWGIQTFAVDHYTSSDEAMALIEDLLLSYNLVNTGDKVILTLGVPVKDQPQTNSVRVLTVGKQKTKKLSIAEIPLRCRDKNNLGL